MILPTKYENISSNAFVVGAEIISNLLDEESLDPDKLFSRLDEPVSLIKYYDVLTLLFALGIIEFHDNSIRLKR